MKTRRYSRARGGVPYLNLPRNVMHDNVNKASENIPPVNNQIDVENSSEENAETRRYIPPLYQQDRNNRRSTRQMYLRLDELNNPEMADMSLSQS